MKPLWKVKGFEKQTYQPQQTRKDTRTDRRKVTVMHKTSRRTGTGTGTARRGTSQDSTGEQNRQGDTENTLTFRALHGNHIVSIPFETIVKKKRETWKITSSNEQTRHASTSPRHAICFSSILFSHILDSYVFLYSLYKPGHHRTIQYLIPGRTTNVELLKQVKN